ncbi:MAG TPA: LLM class flavin-dependent oxidoreductase [Streptosporangiaceae bacterium]|jgi:alkanesulfonate monooxygenase SsuD/methylene tetrahydromethanopterin reductase-like flavin-dependent oxidoreductase (luciferase family)
MHIGYVPTFQNPQRHVPDLEVYRQELRLAELAEPLDFDSVWSVEHHFTDLAIVPDVPQFLSYMAARTTRINLGSMVVVLPWHDPIRVAEQASMLDNLSGGRMILGIGRGLGRIEFEGFGVPMGESRERFNEAAQIVIEALKNGYAEYDGKYYQQPRRDIRPDPFKSFDGRTFAAAVSPDSISLLAGLGVGLLVVPQKPWAMVEADARAFRSSWQDIHGQDSEPPAPMCGGMYFVDENADRAEELAHRYIGSYYDSVMKHYEMSAGHFKTTKGYEFYDNVTQHINRRGEDAAKDDFVTLMPWGTPQQVFDKLVAIHDLIGFQGLMCHFSYSDMPYDEAERSMRLFAREIMPELRLKYGDERAVGKVTVA